MKFPTVITDHVKKEFYKDGATGIVFETKSSRRLILDLNEITFRRRTNVAEAKGLCCYLFCAFLQNRYSRSDVEDHFLLNMYLERDIISQLLDSLTARALEIAEEEV